MKEYIKPSLFHLTFETRMALIKNSLNCKYMGNDSVSLSDIAFEFMMNDDRIISRTFNTIAHNLPINGNYIFINEDDIIDITKNKTRYNKSIKLLIQNNVIAETTVKNGYVINPAVFFKGRYDIFEKEYDKLYGDFKIEVDNKGRIVID